MNDLICATCGKPNPDTVEICQHCGAVLKKNATEPLTPIHPGENPVKKQTAELERTLPSWLRDIRKASKEDNSASESPSSEQPAAAPAPKQEPPKKTEPASPLDYLAGLSQTGEEEEETPDWLKSLQSSMPTPAEIPPASAPVQEQSGQMDAGQEWGHGNQPASLNFDENTAEQSLQTNEKTPDWLKTLKAQDQTVNFSPVDNAMPPVIPIAGDLPPSGDLPDWLSALSDADSGTPPNRSESKPLEVETASDQGTPSTGDPSGWFNDLGGGFTPATEETSAASSAFTTPPADAPDWMANLGGVPTSASEPSELAAIPQENVPASDFPSWLADQSTTQQIPEDSGTMPASEDLPPTGKTPDWIAGQEEQTTTAQPAEVSAIPESGDLPPWLAEAMGESPAETPKSTDESARPVKAFDTGTLGELGPLPNTGNLPDWMAGLGTSSKTSTAPSTSQPVSDTSPVSESSPALQDFTQPEASISETPPAGDLPDWLGGIAVSGAGAAAFEEEPIIGNDKSIPVASVQTQPLPFEAPPAAAETESPFPPSNDNQNIDSLLSMDMPDWLSGFTPTDAEKADNLAPTQAEANNLRPADLPSWVQAMRPVESMVTEETGESEEEQFIENEGPLAGLHSVLPVQSGMPLTHKSKTFSIKLQADETQQAQATLLENLLNSESTPQAVMQNPEALIIRPLRWIIAGVLLVVVLLGALMQDMLGTQVFPAPSLPAEQSEIGNFMKTVSDLPDNAPVLVVVDYQPGFAGEMEPASEPVIDQLMGKNSRLAFISTSPMGTYMAERLLQNFATKYPYKLGTQYVNLGYLPGGASGIQVFAEQPGTTVGQDTILGNLWDAPALKDVTINDVTKLSYFAAMVVLTDSPDTGRLWIEQAKDSLGNQPMLMVVSAQAEPMIRPYVLSGQLTGLVAGLEGGTIYNNQLGISGQARFYWDAFGTGLIAAELLIMIGGAWGLVAGLRARRTEIEQDEA